MNEIYSVNDIFNNYENNIDTIWISQKYKAIWYSLRKKFHHCPSNIIYYDDNLEQNLMAFTR